jgi:hypothetical protein
VGWLHMWIFFNTTFLMAYLGGMDLVNFRCYQRPYGK